MKEEYRNRITLLSFVLTVFVIWLHAGESLISTIPGQIAVPGFFLLSGFLFFYGAAEKEKPAASEAETLRDIGETENKSSTDGTAVKNDTGFFGQFAPPWMREKLRRRVHTLLIPYLCWNFLYFLIYLAAGKAEITEIFEAVFHYSCNPVFWYLFQLILITAVTPLLYRVMKEKNAAVAWLIVIFLLAVFYGPVHAALPVQFINEDAFFYYSVGAFIALHICKEENAEAGNTESTEKFKAWGKVLAAAGAMLVFGLAGKFLPALLYNVSIIGVRLSGVLLLWFLIEKVPVCTCSPAVEGDGKETAAVEAAEGAGSEKECENRTVRNRGIRIYPWMKISFFIYATHYMVIRLVWAGETALGLNGVSAANIVTYLLMPAVCTAAAYGLFMIMKKFLPKLLRLLTGGRGMQD